MYRKHVKQNKKEACKSSKSRMKVQKRSLFQNQNKNYLKVNYDFLVSLEECIEEVSREQMTKNTYARRAAKSGPMFLEQIQHI